MYRGTRRRIGREETAIPVPTARAYRGDGQYAKKLVKVMADSPRPDTCKHCGGPVQWWRTAIRQRWVLFDPDTREHKRRVDPAGQAFAYLDHAGVHWNHCKPPSSLTAA